MARRSPRLGRHPADSDLWLARPDIWAGAALAAAAAVRSFAPSLQPRKTPHQAMVTGASASLGFALGNASYGFLARSGSTIGDLAVAGVAGGAALAASKSVDGHDHDPAWQGVARSGAELLAAGSLATAGVVVMRDSPRRAVLVGLAGGAVTVRGAQLVARGLTQQQTAHEGREAAPLKALPALGQSLGVAAVLTMLVNGYRHTGRLVTRTFQRRLGMRPTTSHWAGDVVALAAWVGTGKALSNTFVNGLRTYDRVVDPGYDRAPDSEYRSSGPGSPLAFARMGREGRKFVTNCPTAEEIEIISGRRSALEPVRVFVGYDHARSVEERVGLAIEELRRTGGFDRALLVVGCPAGNGWVNTLPLEVLDHVLGGDTAAVAVQYARLPSVLALNRVTIGGDSHRRLLEAIRDELADRPPERRPRVVVYGESLGAWAGQDAFLHGGIEAFDELGVDRALWAGTPAYSKWRKEVLHGTVVVPEGSVREVSTGSALAGLDRRDLAPLRAVIITHDDDPVHYIELPLLVEEPAWMKTPRPAGVPASMEWLPGVTAVQVIVDTLNATRPTPGVFGAYGHDYRGDLPELVLDAYGVARPAPDVWERLLAHLAEQEGARAAAYRLPTQTKEQRAAVASERRKATLSRRSRRPRRAARSGRSRHQAS